MKFIDRLFARMIDRRIAEYQSDLIEKHCAEVENMYRQVRGWRHDYHNHIQTMLALLGDDDRLRAYLLDLNDDLTTVDTVIKTGNVMVDAILNSKLSILCEKGITVNTKAVVPAELPVSEIDLCTIIGNLLDNAAENAGTAEESWIRIYIGILKDNLYLSVSNSVAGEIRKTGKIYHSTKGNGHGFGLLRIDRITQKYGGYVNRQNEDGVFVTEIMLPLK
ncbi:MAG: sensor histidine kinase [Clostridia bacterium]|nr:sensor histidine kinase [Clostridia bacterium]